MKRHWNKIRLAYVLMWLLGNLWIFTIASGAFDANDYDSGSSDYSSGSDWSSSDSDWSSSDYSSGSSGSSHSSGGKKVSPEQIAFYIGGFFTLWNGILVACILKKDLSIIISDNLYYPKLRKLKQELPNSSNSLPNRTEQILSIMKERDPSFSADAFETFAQDTWRRVQHAWCKRDLAPVRSLMGSNLYNTTNKQVAEKIANGILYHYEDITFPACYLTSYVRDKEFEYLTVFVHARYIDYQTDEHTGAVLRGDDHTHWNIKYKMKFQRSLNVSIVDATCPNCGAPLDKASSINKCQYCGTVITHSQHDWVLSDFMSVRDDTVDDGIRIPESDTSYTNTDEEAYPVLHASSWGMASSAGTLFMLFIGSSATLITGFFTGSIYCYILGAATIALSVFARLRANLVAQYFRAEIIDIYESIDSDAIKYILKFNYNNTTVVAIHTSKLLPYKVGQRVSYCIKYNGDRVIKD